MYRIAINGTSSRAGGGKSILHNYLQLLDRSVLEDRYSLLTADPDAFAWITNDRIQVVGLPKRYGDTLFAPLVHELLLDRMLKRYQIDLVFNLADLVVRTKVKQVYLFDWPYAINPNSVVWQRMDRRDLLVRKIKLSLLRRRIRRPVVTIAQTPVAKEALERLYRLPNVAIVPNAVSLDNLDTTGEKRFALPAGRKLLYLTYYYPHKNLEILIDVAVRIRELGRDYRIILTIAANQHKNAARLLQEIRDRDLVEIIVNVGPVAMADVPSLYRSCDGLLMPTLLESFSGTYVEAMFHGIPIFTSDLDFAKGVCGDAACYFDPHDPHDIMSKLDTVFDDPRRVATLVRAGERALSSLPDWPHAFERYQEIIGTELERGADDVDH